MTSTRTVGLELALKQVRLKPSKKLTEGVTSSTHQLSGSQSINVAHGVLYSRTISTVDRRGTILLVATKRSTCDNIPLMFANEIIPQYYFQATECKLRGAGGPWSRAFLAIPRNKRYQSSPSAAPRTTVVPRDLLGTSTLIHDGKFHFSRLIAAHYLQCNRQYPCDHCTRRRRPELCTYVSQPAQLEGVASPGPGAPSSSQLPLQDAATPEDASKSLQLEHAPEPPSEGQPDHGHSLQGTDDFTEWRPERSQGHPQTLAEVFGYFEDCESNILGLLRQVNSTSLPASVRLLESIDVANLFDTVGSLWPADVLTKSPRLALMRGNNQTMATQPCRLA